MSSIDELKHLQIPLSVISLATNGFAKENHIGSGGFGQVYKGYSQTHGDIAVKRLDRVLGQGDREFKTEIALLSIYKHDNISSLYGFCDEDGEKILVYKYESKGSLDKYLDNKDLTWIQRIRICIDACSGLRYLHDEVGPQHRIIHRDVKSSNILLDENWRAKISDFGLSKIGPANVGHTFLISNACGTIGYIDPEYLDTAMLTKESDVYSFGVVLFEILCGKPAHSKIKGQMLYALAQKHFEIQTLDEIIHPDLRQDINAASLTTFSTIAYQCLKKRRKERPTMKKVMEQLQKALEDQLAPSGSSSRVHDGFYDDFAAFYQGQSRARRHDDAESIGGDDNDNDDEKERQKMLCKMCLVRSSCVLLLPCRHLCCCNDCGSLVMHCPVCGNAKNASVVVIIGPH